MARKPGTGSDTGFGLGVNDAGNEFGITLASGILDLPSLLDGFTAWFLADPGSWVYEISGIEVDGVATALSDGGSYPEGFAFEEHFDSDDYLTTSIQSCTGNELVMEVDRMMVETDVSGPSADFDQNGLLNRQAGCCRRRPAYLFRSKPVPGRSGLLQNHLGYTVGVYPVIYLMAIIAGGTQTVPAVRGLPV